MPYYDTPREYDNLNHEWPAGWEKYIDVCFTVES